ncbi:MAG: response regulator [Anaerolineae bacterium]|nr:response regulator [Anaerolineae bacterium]
MSQFRAIVIEDDRSVANVYTEALRVAGYESEVIGNGRAALDRLRDIVPTLVLLDLHLPEVAGEEILTAVRADPRLADTCVFLVTADHLLAEKMRDDANLVLLKPVSFTQLRDMAIRFRPAE